MVPAIRVLHVDDDLAFAELTAEFLEREHDHFTVATESSAIEGLERLDAASYDCLVSDYQMPGMDGIEFLQTVREDHPDLPFILFTGKGSEEVASDALSAGATEYLQKEPGPDQYALLANRIENAVESHRARERVADLERIRKTVRDINQALVRATSREEIETRACEIIGRLESVPLVAISSVDPDTDRVEPRTVVGDASEYLEAVEVAVDEADGGHQGPHARAYHERTVAVSRDIQADPALAPWHDAAVEHELHAFVVVPLEYEDDLYGLLSLYGGEVQPIDAEARELLKEVGDDIGHTLDANEARRELEASEARYRSLTHAVSDAILTIDPSSTITFANAATEELFGYSREELRGSELTRLMPERLRQPHREGLDRYLRSGDRQLDWNAVELTGQHEDGTEIPVSVSFGEFDRNGQRHFIGVIRDVTERTERQAELRRQNEYLDEFAGIVAHDLQNPLSVARGRIELAQAEHESEHLRAAAGAVDRMQDLVEDLLVLARHGQDADDVAPLPLEEVVETARGAVHGNPVTLETDGPLDSIVGHRGRVRALVENLFRNAVEHGEWTVTVRVSMLEDGFAVEDDGPGISKANRDSVFDPGFTTKDDGTGFGLNIVEKVVEAHGWEIAVTEGTDGGARFEITGVELVS